MRKLALILALQLIIVLFPTTSVLANSNPCPFKAELPSGIQLVLNGELEDFQIRGVCAGVIEATELFDKYGADLPSAKIYLFADRRRAINKSAALTSKTNARQIWTNNISGFATGSNIIINSNSTNWKTFRDTTIHELTHVLQRNSNEAVWLREGSANYMRSLAAEMRGEWNMDKRRKSFGEYIYRYLEEGDTNLRLLESSSGFRRAEKGYAIAYIAFDLLVSESEGGVKDYLSCYLPERRSMSWRNAFEKCFDMSVGEFYNLFKEYESLGFSELPIERRERERAEFELVVAQCRVRAVWMGNLLVRAMC